MEIKTSGRPRPGVRLDELASGQLFRVVGDTAAVLYMSAHLPESTTMVVPKGKAVRVRDGLIVGLGEACAVEAVSGYVVVDL